MKKVRNAVRVFVVAGNEVLCIRYKEENIGYIDIPGGKNRRRRNRCRSSY